MLDRTVSIHDQAWKGEQRRWVMLTAYDFPTAQISTGPECPRCWATPRPQRPRVRQRAPGHDGGYAPPREAAPRGAQRAMVVGDLPFMSYQAHRGRRAQRRASDQGRRRHGGKLEGPNLDLVHRLTEIGIPAMAHIGLTPQAVHGLGGYKVQGRGEAAQKVLEQAVQLEKAGAFAIVLEAMPAELGAEITRALQIPTIGIGAGSGTDAQVLVINDLLGLTEQPPTLAKAYADLRGAITDAVTNFVSDVEAGTFPDEDHSYT